MQYETSYQRNVIIKVKENRGSTIFWIVMLIIWAILLWSNIRLYLRNEKNGVIVNILANIFWIEFSISNIIKALRSSQLRENGIYKSGYFYKWSKIMSYSWILPNTIQFKVNTIFKTNRNFEITIKEEFKVKVDEVIKRNLAL